MNDARKKKGNTDYITQNLKYKPGCHVEGQRRKNLEELQDWMVEKKTELMNCFGTVLE